MLSTGFIAFHFVVQRTIKEGTTFDCSYIVLFVGTKEFSEKDIAKSLLHMISNDIGQVS